MALRIRAHRWWHLPSPRAVQGPRRHSVPISSMRVQLCSRQQVPTKRTAGEHLSFAGSREQRKASNGETPACRLTSGPRRQRMRVFRPDSSGSPAGSSLRPDVNGMQPHAIVSSARPKTVCSTRFSRLDVESRRAGSALLRSLHPASGMASQLAMPAECTYSLSKISCFIQPVDRSRGGCSTMPHAISKPSKDN